MAEALRSARRCYISVEGVISHHDLVVQAQREGQSLIGNLRRIKRGKRPLADDVDLASQRAHLALTHEEHESVRSLLIRGCEAYCYHVCALTNEKPSVLSVCLLPVDLCLLPSFGTILPLLPRPRPRP